MKISIIIASFNRRRMLADLLDFLIHNPPADARVTTEIIVIDDRSTDGTSEMVTADYPTVRYLLGEGKGAAKAKRIGILSAAGDYIVALDDDSIPEKGWIDAVLPALRNAEQLVQTKIVFKDMNQQNISNEEFPHFQHGFKLSMYPVLVTYGGYNEQYISNCAECGLFMSRTVLSEEPLDDPNLRSDFGESASFYLRISRRGYKVFFEPNSVINHIGSETGGGKEREKKTPLRRKCTPYVIGMVHNFFIFARMNNPLRIPYMIVYFLGVGWYLTLIQRQWCVSFFWRGIVSGLRAKTVPINRYQWSYNS